MLSNSFLVVQQRRQDLSKGVLSEILFKGCIMGPQ